MENQRLVRRTHPAKTAKPGLFVLSSMPDVRMEPASKNTITTASFPALLAISDSAMIGHSSKKQKLTCIKALSTLRMADSEYMYLYGLDFLSLDS